MRCKDDDTCDQTATKADVEQAVNNLALLASIIGATLFLPWVTIVALIYRNTDKSD